MENKTKTKIIRGLWNAMCLIMVVVPSAIIVSNHPFSAIYLASICWGFALIKEEET